MSLYIRHIWSLWGFRHGTACDVGVLTPPRSSSNSGSSGMAAESWRFQEVGARHCDGCETVSRGQ